MKRGLNIGPIRTLLVVVETTASYYGVTPDDIKGRDRHKTVAEARHVATYVGRVLTGLSYPDLGRFLERDHTSIMSACRKVEANHDVLERAYVIANELHARPAQSPSTNAHRNHAALAGDIHAESL